MDKELYDPEEMGFPPYVEEVNPLPDVETDFNFEEHKEEIYRRNIELAKEINAQFAAEEMRKVALKRAEFEKMYTDAERKLAAGQTNPPAYKRSGFFDFIEDFLALFSPNRAVDLNKMSWQIAGWCAAVAAVIFVIMMFL
ncbi:MAG: hypothetical protein NC253_03630 [Ruminococcus sp.]|nr:hypothetical protein [Ruminococcus sp.]MCM1381395.1 hypothetical protein [Muribaculaceae bacterium]MCM1479517.1 hypothetical protein [Muribaculaceae bacterium]